MNAPDVQARLVELGIEVVAPERRSADYLAEVRGARDREMADRPKRPA